MRVGGLSSTDPSPGPLRGDLRPIERKLLGVVSASSRDNGDAASSVSKELTERAIVNSVLTGRTGGGGGVRSTSEVCVLMRVTEFRLRWKAVFRRELPLLLDDDSRMTVVISEPGVGSLSVVTVGECRQHISDDFFGAAFCFDLRLREKKGIRIADPEDAHTQWAFNF